MLIQVNISGMSRVVCQSEFGVVWELLHFMGKQNLSLLNSVFEMTHLSFPVYNPASWVNALVTPHQKVTSLIRHSLPLPNPTTPPPTWTSVVLGSWGCCVCNVTAIFYSCGLSFWVALLETRTQSLLPVNTNLMGLTGWEELWHLGEDGMYKKWTTSMCQTRAKRSERENVAAWQMCLTRIRLRGMTMCWRELLQLPQGVGSACWNALKCWLAHFAWHSNIDRDLFWMLNSKVIY